MLKNIEIIFEGNTYSCELKPDTNDSIICNIYQNGFPNFEGKITLKEIYSQINAFEDYSMEELFTILKDIEKDKFELINASDKYNLKISIQVLKKIKELNIHLEKKSQSNSEILQFLLNEVKTQEKQIEMLEKELASLRELKKKENERKKKEKEYYSINIDITKMKIQRKNNIIEEGEYCKYFKVLEGGRIAAYILKEVKSSSGDSNFVNFIKIIDTESLEIVYKIKEDCGSFLELEKDIIALVKKGKDSWGCTKESILLIKLEEKKYTVLQKSYDSSFGKLAKLLDGTLIASDHGNKEICFFKNKNDLTVKDFSIKYKHEWSYIHFILQTKKNEIAYDDSKMKEIIFYDFVEKKEKNIIKMEVFDFDSLDRNSKVEMISDELLCIIQQSHENFNYCAYLINVYKYEKVNVIPIEESYDKEFRALYPMKGKYLIITTKSKEVIEKIKQFKVEEDNISLMHELEIPNAFFCISFLNNGKNGKFIANDGQNIYEFY